jgi:predicted MFS family arabinose efflux permease
VAGALTSTFGMGGIVLGLVEASTKGWSNITTLGSLVIGAALLVAFVQIERRAEEPILPLRLFNSATRVVANASRGLVYAGMFGMFFFAGQFLQDVQGYSPLRAGLAFLPVPFSVFVSSQLVSKVLSNRVRPKILMLSGIGISIVSLVLASQLHAGVSYLQLLVDLVLLGVGSGISLVSLTTASLAGVEPGDAGAASGLVNVMQQVGAALGLAVLVTVLGAAAGHSQLSAGGAGVATHTLVHGLDVTFGVAALFAVVAFGLVAALVRLPAAERAEVGSVAGDGRDESEYEFEEAELVDGEGFEWVGPDMVA